MCLLILVTHNVRPPYCLNEPTLTAIAYGLYNEGKASAAIAYGLYNEGKASGVSRHIEVKRG